MTNKNLVSFEEIKPGQHYINPTADESNHRGKVRVKISNFITALRDDTSILWRPTYQTNVKKNLIIKYEADWQRLLRRVIKFFEANGTKFWCKSVLAKSSTGKVISNPTSKNACAFCAVGAVWNMCGAAIPDKSEFYSANIPNLNGNRKLSAAVTAIKKIRNYCQIEFGTPDPWLINDRSASLNQVMDHLTKIIYRG